MSLSHQKFGLYERMPELVRDNVNSYQQIEY